MWTDADDEIIAGDLTAALAYVTPAGGAVVTAVAPIGLRDRDAGTVGFTTSLGFGRKLDRIKQDPRVALAYHAREHGFATGPRYVLVQGTATYDSQPDPSLLAETVRPASTRFMGAPRTGIFWDRWLSAYYGDRVLVTVRVERVISWPDVACLGAPAIAGAPLGAEGPGSQAPPRNGTAPRPRRARTSRPGSPRPPHQRSARRASRTPSRRPHRYLSSQLQLHLVRVFTTPRPRDTVADAYRQALNTGLRPVAACGTSPPPRGAGPRKALHTGGRQSEALSRRRSRQQEG